MEINSPLNQSPELAHETLLMNQATILNNDNIKHIHCMGIGGIGVSGLAEILLKQGYQVTGSDIAQTAIVQRLVRLGAVINVEHHAKNVEQADAVVYSSAIASTNPEFKAAQSLGIPMIQRGCLLAELLNQAQGIAVCGTHGKTTTTGIIAYALLHAGLDPTMVMGGIINGFESPVHLGAGPYFVAEADESDASFVHLQPEITILTNVDADHLSTYDGSFDQLKQTFAEFLQKMPSHGTVIACIDDPHVRDLVADLSCRLITYGFSQEADIRADDFRQQGLQSYFNVYRFSDDNLLDVRLNLPGQHNVLNALAAIAVATCLEVNDTALGEALTQFPGVGRRFHYHGDIQIKAGTAMVFDDYGHHPNEVAVTWQAAKQAWPDRRVVFVFQPHRYSRTQDLLNDFVDVLAKMDALILVDVYSAGEKKIPGADSRALHHLVTQQTEQPVWLVPDLKDLPQALAERLQNNDVVIFQGAGSIGAAAREIAAMLSVSK